MATQKYPVNIHLTASEKSLLQAACNKANKPLATWIRHVALKAAGLEGESAAVVLASAPPAINASEPSDHVTGEPTTESNEPSLNDFQEPAEISEDTMDKRLEELLKAAGGIPD